MTDLLTAARLVLEASGDDLVDALAWLDEAVEEESVESNGWMKVHVTVMLDPEDLNGIAERYEEDHGKEPNRNSRKFKAYCRDMVLHAVGAAGAGGWEQGVV